MAAAVRGPKSVEEIVLDAQNFDHNTSYPLRIALRTAQSMLNQATNYERDGNAEAAYLFYYRHAEFYFSLIAKHPDAKKPEFRADVARVRNEVNQDLERLEALKPELKRRYERYQEALRRREAAQKRLSEEKSVVLEDNAFEDSRVLNAGEDNDLALRLANRELRRRREAAAHDDHDVTMDELSQGMRAIGRQLDGSKGHQSEDDGSRTLRYNYPAIPQQHNLRVDSLGQGAASLPPDLPPKASLQGYSSPPIVPSKSPALPSKTQLEPFAAPAAPALPSKEDLSTSNYTFSSTATTEGGLPLRTLFLPAELRAAFLSVAASNTRANLETCGILCGTLISNAFFISRLVIPDQVSTSDTCEVTEEGDIALFDYVDGANMTVCGWIHTHPSQTCFLSSRDLHTSVGYQVMLPESVAVVCAPSKSPDHGIFRLTDPSGKDAILSCHQPGLFHPHAQQNLYTDALRPGHVCELQGLQFEVVDLRSRK